MVGQDNGHLEQKSRLKSSLKEDGKVGESEYRQLVTKRSKMRILSGTTLLEAAEHAR